MDCILISNLELLAHIGITAEERATAQRLTVTLELHPRNSFDLLADDITRTVDYFEVSRRVQALALQTPRNLIETLAGEIASLVLREFPVAQVSVELRKYILPDTEFVAVRLVRPMMEPS